ncbi:MAG: formate dehydrogenase subunit gamma, partial [Acidobacteriia bacterium]|nr:formate dehydrogenase subunit gamma [Terriglobia bacterium]
MKTEVERYSFRERVCHWVSAATYVYCLGTGLAFYTPYLFWMAVALGGGATSRFWHPWIGLVFFAVQMWMHRIWSSDMHITAGDRVWMKGIRNYIENRDDQVPAAGRFNAGQKQFYWMMFYGAFGLLVSGLFMWFPESIPFSTAWIRPVMVVIHEVSALVTIGAFIIHIYMGVFMVPGGL